MGINRFAAAGFTIVLLAAATASGGAAFGSSDTAPTRVVRVQGPLTDLTTSADALDGASARFSAVVSGRSTIASLVVSGIAASAVGMTFGAHVHIGQCVAGDGNAAKGHYNTGGPPSPSTEVWLDFTVFTGGTGVGHTIVPFVIPDGAAHAVVIHAMATAPGGAAGGRLACMTVEF